jgi:hypothetical protein
MFSRGTSIAILFALCVCTFAASSPAGAEEERWPSDVDQEAAELEGRVLEVQRKRAVARLHGKTEEAKKLDKEFDELQKQHIELLRDSGQID